MTAALRGTARTGPSLHPDQVRTLGEGDLVVFDGFLGAASALCAASAMRVLASHGALSPACVGQERLHRPSIRGDHTAWFQQVELPADLEGLWPGFEGLRELLNTEAWLGLQRFELQLACYPGEGERYARHVDSFAEDVSRRVTAILYLNPDWQPAHGGQLRAKTPRGWIEVEPVLDRLVIFLSDRVLHEVLPACAPRFAATAWYRGAEPIPLLPDG